MLKYYQMNLLLLFSDDFIAPGRVLLSDQRVQHLLLVKKIQLGTQLIVGLVNGRVGQGTVVALQEQQLELLVQLDEKPVEALAVHLILALPRPKMLRRILQTISAMGVKQLSLIHSSKVEKSYWQTPWLAEDKIQQQLIAGLQQAKDTLLPEVTCYQRFKPFVEDVAPALAAQNRAVIAHPGRGEHCAAQLAPHVTLAVGPEGGFSDYEVDKFTQAGFSCCHLGERILRVENVIPVLLTRLMSITQ